MVLVHCFLPREVVVEVPIRNLYVAIGGGCFCCWESVIALAEFFLSFFYVY
jgi:hypothetical protein